MRVPTDSIVGTGGMGENPDVAESNLLDTINKRIIEQLQRDGRMSYAALAKEVGKHGIRVNSIHPGAIVTDMIAHMLEGGRDEKMVKHQPIKRLGTPEDIAEMALFLASDRSSYCTGQSFTVDGGVHG